MKKNYGQPNNVTMRKLKFLVLDSTIHPDTGEKILLPFRMASFVPTNLIVVAGMLIPKPTVTII